MRILHYALGFPPYRSGGLTKYCTDLMLTQKQQGHQVAMMWPGTNSLSGHFVRYKKGKKKIDSDVIDSIEIINPLPVPLDEGIIMVDEFMKKCPNESVYVRLLEEYKPDAIHIHTLMGLHREFIKIARRKNIPVVFTTHDYFGICPMVTLYKDGKVCDGNCSRCSECNSGALSIRKIKILQSGLYRGLKNTVIVKKMRQAHRQNFFYKSTENPKGKNTIACGNKETIHKTKSAIGETNKAYVNEKFEQMIVSQAENRYIKLRKYYMSMLKMTSIIHFNSSVSESVYRRFLPDEIKGKVINITHKNIYDNRRIKKFQGDTLRITYLAPAKPFKGYDIMMQALDELWTGGNKKFHITMYNEAEDNKPYMTVNPRFAYSELGNIFDETDVLIMPSAWYETFGFTVLEALSFGVPVIVTDYVGAKDLLEEGKYGMVVEPTKDGVKQAVKHLLENRAVLLEYNQRIVDEMDLDSVMNSAKEIEKLYLD